MNVPTVVCLVFVLLVFEAGLLLARPEAATLCNEGDVKTVDCNTCRCANGIFICTRKFCIKPQLNDAGGARVTRCTDGNCNNRRLIRDARVTRCTDGNCNNRRLIRGLPVAADLKNTPCAPNDYFTIDCNTCYCNIERTGYLCTENLCPLSALLSTNNITNSTTTIGSDATNTFSCTPGQTFQRECNTCKCTADGKNAICSLKGCISLSKNLH